MTSTDHQPPGDNPVDPREITPPVQITKAQVKKAGAALDKINALHDCDPANWTARVSSPGFEPTYMGPGLSTWTCDSCRPTIVEAFTKACGAPPLVTVKP